MIGKDYFKCYLWRSWCHALICNIRLLLFSWWSSSIQTSVIDKPYTCDILLNCCLLVIDCFCDTSPWKEHQQITFRLCESIRFALYTEDHIWSYSCLLFTRLFAASSTLLATSEASLPGWCRRPCPCSCLPASGLDRVGIAGILHASISLCVN